MHAVCELGLSGTQGYLEIAAWSFRYRLVQARALSFFLFALWGHC